MTRDKANASTAPRGIWRARNNPNVVRIIDSNVRSTKYATATERIAIRIANIVNRGVAMHARVTPSRKAFSVANIPHLGQSCQP